MSAPKTKPDFVVLDEFLYVCIVDHKHLAVVPGKVICDGSRFEYDPRDLQIVDVERTLALYPLRDNEEEVRNLLKGRI